MKKFTSFRTVALLIVLFATKTLSINAQNSAIFPLDFVPHEETITEVSTRETRLTNNQKNFFDNLNSAINTGTLSTWVNYYLPTLDINSDMSAYTNSLYELTRLSIDYNYSQLVPILTTKLNDAAQISLTNYKKQSLLEISQHYTGLPRDLNTVIQATSMLRSSVCLKLLGVYTGAAKDSTESFINKYIENKGDFVGNFITGGHNKEIYKMDIGSLIAFLYKEDTLKFPVSKKTFEGYWYTVTRQSYENDNSPHYDSSTGTWLILYQALLHDRLNDLKIRDDFHRILTRMARTVMNSGECAKWSKWTGRIYSGNTQPTCDGGYVLHWDLKMGYLLFNDPFLLYVSRKYEDLRFNGPIADWATYNVCLYPKGINFETVKNVISPVNTTNSIVTKRLTGQPNNPYKGLSISRGDTNTVLVQDKLVLSTGHHPRAPYMMIDMSYTENKSSGDHRIGVDNLMFDGTQLNCYLDRPGNGTQVSRPILCPVKYTFPIIPALYGDVFCTLDYTTKMGGFDSSFDYVIKTDSVKDLSANAAFGVIEYSKFQYTGVSAKREILLLHNGITLIVDRMKTNSLYNGGFNAGVIYQIVPSISSKDVNNRWVLQSNHIPTLVDRTGNPSGFSTLYYFPKVGTITDTSILTDDSLPSHAIDQDFSAFKVINSGDSVNILSMMIPIRNTSLAQNFVNSIKTTENNGTFNVIIPKDASNSISVKFEPNKIPTVIENLNTTDVEELSVIPNLELKQNFPNPFSHSTTIQYRLNNSSKVILRVYNLLGSEVVTLVNDTQNADNYSVNFDTSKLNSGIYFYSLSACGSVITKKMTIQ